MALSGTRMVLLSLLMVAVLAAVPAARAVDSHWTNDGHHRRAPPVLAAPPPSSGPAPAPSPIGGVTNPSPATSATGTSTSSPAPSPAAEIKNSAAASRFAWPALLVCAAGVAAVATF